MSAQLIGFPYDPFILFALPTFCSYQPQTPVMIDIPEPAPVYGEGDDSPWLPRQGLLE